jgi:hypothetical protein
MAVVDDGRGEPVVGRSESGAVGGDHHPQGWRLSHSSPWMHDVPLRTILSVSLPVRVIDVPVAYGGGQPDRQEKGYERG